MGSGCELPEEFYYFPKTAQTVRAFMPPGRLEIRSGKPRWRRTHVQEADPEKKTLIITDWRVTATFSGRCQQKISQTISALKAQGFTVYGWQEGRFLKDDYSLSNITPEMPALIHEAYAKELGLTRDETLLIDPCWVDYLCLESNSKETLISLKDITQSQYKESNLLSWVVAAGRSILHHKFSDPDNKLVERIREGYPGIQIKERWNNLDFRFDVFGTILTNLDVFGTIGH